MKHPNMQALAAALTLAGAMFFGPPAASAQETPAPPAPATPPPEQPAPPAEAQPAQAQASTVIRPAPPPPPVERKITTPIIVSGALSGAALVSGVVFGIMAAGDNSSYKQTPNNDVALAGEQKAFISDVSFGVSVLFGFAALALYLLPDEPTPEAPPAAAPPKAAKSTRSWITSALKGEVLSF
ncbi:MAG: hypothetical protein KIT84_23310 [Labilithrix sp.]|nr:hypothetical protein [Labilithrix sp.]MCW5813976.1 hypothetical protein [Labilithrix sp.]